MQPSAALPADERIFREFAHERVHGAHGRVQLGSRRRDERLWICRVGRHCDVPRANENVLFRRRLSHHTETLVLPLVSPLATCDARCDDTFHLAKPPAHKTISVSVSVVLFCLSVVGNVVFSTFATTLMKRHAILRSAP